MTETDLLSLCRLYVPECLSTVITDVNALIILNQAAQKFVYLSEALPTSTLFNVVASQQEYLLSTNVTTFSKVRPEGLWWYDSVNSSWVQLKGRTIKWLDEITVYPKPLTAVSNGFKLYHFKISTDMSAGAYYPFSGSLTVRYPFLANYEEDLLDYYKYRSKQIMGYGQQAQEALEMFTTKALKAKAELKTRTDLTDARATPQTRYRKGMFR